MANTVVPNVKLVDFSDLGPADAFISTESGKIFAKIDSETSEFNAFNLSTGRLAKFEDDEKVIQYVGSSLVIATAV